MTGVFFRCRCDVLLVHEVCTPFHLLAVHYYSNVSWRCATQGFRWVHACIREASCVHVLEVCVLWRCVLPCCMVRCVVFLSVLCYSVCPLWFRVSVCLCMCVPLFCVPGVINGIMQAHCVRLCWWLRRSIRTLSILTNKYHPLASSTRWGLPSPSLVFCVTCSCVSSAYALFICWHSSEHSFLCIHRDTC